MAKKEKAVVFGGSGITGRNLAERLVAQGWDVTCVSRRAHSDLPGGRAISCDLTDAGSSARALSAVAGASYAFICNWGRQANEKEKLPRQLPAGA